MCSNMENMAKGVEKAQWILSREQGGFFPQEHGFTNKDYIRTVGKCLPFAVVGGGYFFERRGLFLLLTTDFTDFHGYYFSMLKFRAPIQLDCM